MQAVLSSSAPPYGWWRHVAVACSYYISVLQQLHESHQDTSQIKQRARLTVYWPGLDNDIENMVSQCRQCQTLCRPIPKSQWRPNQDHCIHLKSLLFLRWPMILNCCWLLYRLAHHCSHGEECQSSNFDHSFEGAILQNSSLMEDHSSLPEDSKTLQQSGSSSIKPPPPLSLKPPPPLSPEQWKGRSNY